VSDIEVIDLHLPAVAQPKRELVPGIIARAGSHAVERVIEFFTAEIRNPNTRRAYGRAAASFFSWMEIQGLALEQIAPVHVATWVEQLQEDYEAASVKQQLAGVRMLFDYLVTGGVLRANPVSSVRGPRLSARRGKTPILDGKEGGQLLSAIPTDTIVGLRDRALIALMTYTFARIGAVLTMKVKDVFRERSRLMVRLREKGGKRHEMPCHHLLEDYLATYIEAAGIAEDRDGPLFRSIDRKSKMLSGRPMSQDVAWDMVNRRARQAGIETAVCNHTFRGTGITTYLENGGVLERARDMANHASMRTTQLYDRRSDKTMLKVVPVVRTEFPLR
jgi:site-specific recombinase XerD